MGASVPGCAALSFNHSGRRGTRCEDSAAPGLRVTIVPMRLSGWAVFALLLAIGFATHGASLDNQLILDDEYMVRDNQDLRDLRRVPAFFVSTPPQKINRGYYRPLMLASFALDRALFGEDRRAYHAVDIALHALTAFIVWLSLRRLVRAELPSLLGSLLFLLHPVQTEVVYLVTYRATCLAALFFFAALLVHVSKPQPSLPRSLAIGALYFASLASKESGIMLPGALFLSDVLLRERPWSARPYIACGIVLAAYLGLRQALCEPSGIAYFAGASVDAIFRAMTVVEAYALLLVLLPVRLIGTYDGSLLPAPSSFVDLWFALSAVLLLGLLLLAVRVRRSAPLVAFGIGFHFLTLVPTYNIAPIPNLFGERFLYLPLFGACVIASALLARTRSPRLQVVWSVATAAVICAFGLRSHVRAYDFRDATSYWQATVAALPESLQAHIGLATTYRKNRQCQRALPHYTFALAHADPRPQQARLIYGEAASCQSLSGNNAEARTIIEAWLRWHPDDPGFTRMRQQLLAAAQ